MKKRFFSFLTIAVLAASFFVIGCQDKDVAQPLLEPDANELAQPTNNSGLSERAACSTVTDGCGAGNYTNCVTYARCKQPKLPYGLFSYDDKKKIINTQTASTGCVAVINVGNSVGHVAYVQSVSGTNITIRETNWCSTTKVSTRTGTKSGLSIVGYFKP